MQGKEEENESCVHKGFLTSVHAGAVEGNCAANERKGAVFTD
jgi:hypothetical protein